MIVITGAAGFIGSCLVSTLNSFGKTNLVIVDDFSSKQKNKNLYQKQCVKRIDRGLFIEWLANNAAEVSEVYHIGARTDTTECNLGILEELNVNYSKSLWGICSEFKIPFIYASSAATYGTGEFGFEDNHELVEKLRPLNLYGESKNNFDKWVLLQENQPPFWAGIKFFNVYGPNEFHKKRMASVIFHAVDQIQKTGGVQLFRSHHSDYKDGEQERDFIYVKDVVKVLMFMMKKQISSGIFNLGTGYARTFNDLIKAIFSAMDMPSKISYINIPEDLRERYQYFTQADMNKLKGLGYKEVFTSLENGVNDYVQGYLLSKTYY